ncbi:hypothetical protein MUK72_00290 [Halococcus dombrowskii]|uniref:Uncharacterized protein n=1 Tax=Halococcus dombrowskii TaxID=179637 RepID=A0AAX3AM06_HALDO|nr:hypothetical protein [Halococcus dombrowskii]UOO95179.1 hypothetical protein MUK72_00290 [Halococcus dombrowskii]
MSAEIFLRHGPTFRVDYDVETVGYSVVGENRINQEIRFPGTGFTEQSDVTMLERRRYGDRCVTDLSIVGFRLPDNESSFAVGFKSIIGWLAYRSPFTRDHVECTTSLGCQRLPT